MKKITRELLEAGRSSKGGWSAKQIDCLNIPWPVEGCWHDVVIGQNISDDNHDKFIALKDAHLKPKPKKRILQQSPIRYFFDQDSSSHWYMVPESIREVWDKWRDLDEDLEEAWTPPEGAIHLGSYPNGISFENPSNLNAK